MKLTKISRIVVLIVICALFQLTYCSKNAKSPAKSEGFKPVDPFEQNAKMGRGVNLGNALEAPNEGDWGVVIKNEYFDLITNADFNNIRIPVRWSTHAAHTPDYDIDPLFFHRVDGVINGVLSKGLIAILNMHHYEEIFESPDTHKERFLGMWRQIAERYKDYSSNLVFEILNEPHGNLTSSKWNELLVEALAVVRESNPERNVIIGAEGWNNVNDLRTLILPEDDKHIIVTYHYYNPFHFTHQGADWAGEEASNWLGTTWSGTDSEKQAVDNDFEKALLYSQEHNRPIYMGEFGAYSMADSTSRATWTDYVAKAAEKRSFSWSYWEFCSGFGVYDSDQKKWNQYLLDALIPN